MITNRVLRSVFCIRIGNDRGTAFHIEVEGTCYLFTAAHLLGNFKGEIEVYKEGVWEPVPCSMVTEGGGEYDVSVLFTEKTISESALLPSRNHHVGQEARFVGFPQGHPHLGPDDELLPTVRGCLISSMSKDGQIIRLDNRGNFGFSGSPVLVRDGSAAVARVAGVVVEVVREKSPIYSAQGERTDMHVMLDLGEVIAHNVQKAVDEVLKRSRR